jgi:hypothetical protein
MSSVRRDLVLIAIPNYGRFCYSAAVMQTEGRQRKTFDFPVYLFRSVPTHTPKGGDVGETIMVVLVMPVILALVVVLIRELKR